MLLGSKGEIRVILLNILIHAGYRVNKSPYGELVDKKKKIIQIFVEIEHLIHL